MSNTDATAQQQSQHLNKAGRHLTVTAQESEKKQQKKNNNNKTFHLLTAKTRNSSLNRTGFVIYSLIRIH